jgi:hypothetical protein
LAQPRTVVIEGGPVENEQWIKRVQALYKSFTKNEGR